MAEDYPFKLIVVGAGGIGKSAMCISYITNSFPTDYIPTVFDCNQTSVEVAGIPYALSLYDTNGAPEYDALRLLYYPGTDAALLCFSVDKPKSLEEIKNKFNHHVVANCPGAIRILVGLKKDSREDEAMKKRMSDQGLSYVTQEQAEKLREEIGAAKYLECSALTMDGLKTVFEEALACGATPAWKKRNQVDTKTPKKEEPLPDVQKGKIAFNFKKAVGVKSADKNGFSDPYVEVRAYGAGDKDDRKGIWKSKAVKKTLNPVWDEKVNMNIDPEKLRGTEGLAVQVWDWDAIGKNDFLGEVQLSWQTVKSSGDVVEKKLEARHWKAGEEVKGTIDFTYTYTKD